MNARASARALVIGIGNPLRRDDGLGREVAEQLARDGEKGCDMHSVHQLTPELAQEMAAASLVVMVDASREGEPGEVRLRSVPPSAQASAVGAHFTAPEELAALTALVYGQCPPVVLVTMAGTDFSLGEQLSAIVAQNIPLLCATVRQICTRAKDDEIGTRHFSLTLSRGDIPDSHRTWEI